MVKQFKYYTFLIVAIIVTTGCSKFFEQKPDNRIEVTTPEQVQQLLVTAYPKGNYIPFCEIMSDNAEDKGNLAFLNEVNSRSYFFEDNTSQDIDGTDFYFKSCYSAIAAANKALQVINTAKTPDLYKVSKGEALVARAYAHFMLVSLYAKTYNPATADKDEGIPYVTEPETTVFGKYERGTVAEVYENIEKDLVEAIPLIDDNSYGDKLKFHFTRKAVHAFAARFYLFRQQYDNAVYHAGQVFAGNATSYLRNWNTTYSNLQYADLLAIYTKASEPANLLLQEAYSQWGSAYFLYRYGYGTKLATDVWFSNNNPAAGNYAIGYNTYGSGPQFYNIPKFFEHFVYASPTVDYGYPYNTIPLLSAEEVLFNRAEANAMLGNNAAVISDLNTWLSKNIVEYNSATHNVTVEKIVNFYKTGSNIQKALLQCILDFKRVCFVHEGLRWWDVIRHGITVVHTGANGRIETLLPDDKRRLLQLPQEAVLSGVNLNPR